MLPNQRNSRRIKNDSCFGLTSRKHRFLLRQIFSGSSPQRKLLIFVFFAAVGFSVTLGLIIYLGLKYFNSQTTCMRPECIIAANRLLEGMNTSVNPCEDFYEYVCGNWRHSHSTPDDFNSWFIERSKFINNEIKIILMEKHSDPEPKPVSQMKDFYKMCMNTSYLNNQGLQPLYDLLDLLELPRMLPYPGISPPFNLAKVVARSKKLLDLDIFMRISLHFNITLNTTFLTISPAPPKQTDLRPNHKIFKIRTVSVDDFVGHLNRYMTDVMKEFAPAVSKDDISRVVAQILFLDTTLKLLVDSVGPSTTGRIFHLKQLETFMFRENDSGDPPFSWRDYVSTLTHGSNVSLQINDTIIVANEKYFRALGINFSKFNRIDFEQYVWWKIIDDLVVHTTDRMRSYKFIFYDSVYRGFTKYSRALDCISLIKSTFPETITHVLAKRNPVLDSMIKVKSMLSRMKDSLKLMIKNSAWLDHYTKAANIKKADDVEVSIGYPKNSRNSTFLTEKFGNVDIIQDDFMSSLINIRSVPTAKILNSICAYVSDPYYYVIKNYDDTIDYNEPNSFYRREFNAMYVLSGIIQYPFFIDGVESLNYGAVGFILGHELMHGFDREGILHDWNGYKRKFWNENMTKVYNHRAECFINQYQQYYVIDNKTINGNRTLSENIADNEGLRMAYYAYEDYVAENGVELALPAFENFSHQQLLFMSFANVYCVQENKFHLKFMSEDVHSPQKSRIIGTLSNMPEFAESWNCPPNASMNPYKKCSLW